jgi:tetratricopeptide (TPR) repeat protein
MIAGSPADAAKTYRQVTDADKSLLVRYPTNVPVLRQLSSSAGRLCSTLMMVGDGPGSLDICTESLDASERVATVLPPADAARLRRSLMLSSSVTMAEAYELNDRWDDARARYVRALADLEDAARRMPEYAMVRLHLARTLGKFADLLDRQHDPIAARDHYREAISLLEPLHRGDALEESAGSALANTLSRYARVQAGQRDRVEAHRAATRAMNLWRELFERHQLALPGTYYYVRELSTSIFPELRNAPLALRIARESMDASHTPSPDALRALAMACAANGDTAGAIRETERALTMLAPLPPGAHATGLRRIIEEELAAYRSQ